MKLVIEVEVPDDVAANPGHWLGVQDHVQLEAQQAVKDYVDCVVNPDGCWCTTTEHLESCRHYVTPD